MIHLLGDGAEGNVWLGKHEVLGDLRAIKILKPHLCLQRRTRSRFRRVAQFQAQNLRHRGIVSVLDGDFSDDGTPYVVMEYVPGHSLDKILNRGTPMPLTWIVRMLAPLLDALQFAHDRHISHRDLKPSNLLFADARDVPEGVKICDFGLGRLFGAQWGDGQGSSIAANSIQGTPPYMSPEQINGEVDPRADIYSVGVILYQLLTGYLPFEGTVLRMLADTLDKAAPTFTQVDPASRVPAEIETVVRRCLAKTADDRPSTPKLLAREFQDAVSASCAHAKRPSFFNLFGLRPGL